MGRYNPEEKQMNIVLIGNFNPRIFQPQWFANEGIISEADLNYIVEDGDVLIHKQVAQFKSSWFHLEVTETRLNIVTTQEAYFELILDFLTATFSVLHHTPIAQMGINLRIHQLIEKKDAAAKFDNKYFAVAGFSKIDKQVEPSVTKLRFSKDDIKIGTICNYELSKLSDNHYVMTVNQHFEIGQEASGKEFLKIIGEKGRKAMNANDTVLRTIIEMKN